MKYLISYDGHEHIDTAVEENVSGKLKDHIHRTLLKMYANDVFSDLLYCPEKYSRMDCNNIINHEVTVARPRKGIDRYELDWTSYLFRFEAEERENRPGFDVY